MTTAEGIKPYNFELNIFSLSYPEVHSLTEFDWTVFYRPATTPPDGNLQCISNRQYTQIAKNKKLLSNLNKFTGWFSC